MMNRKFRSGKKTGFTLVEILLVMLITSILVLGINTAFRQAHTLWYKGQTEQNVCQKSRQLFDALREELLCLYMPSDSNSEQLVPFRLATMADGTTTLSFCSLNPSWKDATLSNYPAKITYESKPENESNFLLTRIEQLYSGEKAIESQQSEVVFKDMSKLSILATDPNAGSDADTWRDNLECKNEPPKALKIKAKWVLPDGREYVFETIIRVACDKLAMVK